MKNKKYWLLMLLTFLVAMCLGVGYAVSTRSINIETTANAAVDFSVEFVEVVSSSNCTVTIDSDDPKRATLTATLLEFDEPATAKLKIKNKSTNLGATLDYNGLLPSTYAPTSKKYVYISANLEADELEPLGETYFNVTITLKKIAVDNPGTYTTYINFYAEAKEMS